MKNITILFISALLISSCSSTRNFASRGVEQEVKLPVKTFEDTPELLRYTAVGTSYDYNMSRTIAQNQAKGGLAAKIESIVKGGNSTYQKNIDKVNTRKGKPKSSYYQIAESEITVIVDQVLRNIRTVDEKVTKNSWTRQFTAYVTLEIPINGIADAVYYNLPEAQKMQMDRAAFRDYLKTR